MKKSFLTVREFLKKYKWDSIFFKYLRYTLYFFVLPSVIIGSFAFTSYNSILKRNAYSQSEENAQKAFASVNDMANEVNSVYSILSSNEAVASYMYTESVLDFVPNELPAYNTIRTLLGYCIQTSSSIKSIDIYGLSNNYILSSSSSNFYENYYNKEILKPFTDDGKYFYIVPSNTASSYFNYNSISFGYAYTNNNTPLGVIVITIDTSKFSSLLSLGKNDSIELADNNGNIVYSSAYERIGKTIDYDLTGITAYPNFVSDENTSELSFYTEFPSEIRVIYNSSTEYIASANRRVIVFAVTMIILALLLPLFMAFYSSLMIYKVILRIMSAIHTTTQSESLPANFDEIEFISNNILDISKAKDEVEKELAKSMSTLKSTQSVALQMQISPHFLFNTLNVVSFIIMDTVKGDSDAQKVISLLSSFLNDILSSNETITELDAEIKTLKKYTEIELIKNNYDFEIIWDIAEDTLNAKTVKFILQPIVENALQHGIHPVEEIEGIIKIQSRIKDDYLEIKIINNGETIPKDKLDELRLNLELNDMPEQHIGLLNVNQRIRILYGDAYGCSISSENGFTTVTILQPIK